MGWTYPDLAALPADIYDVLVEWLNEQSKARESRMGGERWSG